MKPLKTPPSGPQDLQVFAEQLKAYAQTAGPRWTKRSLRKNARDLYNCFRRIGDANGISLGEVAAALDVPFAPQTAQPPSSEELADIIQDYCREHGAQSWNISDIAAKSKEAYNALERYAYANGLSSRGEAARAVGHPFTKKRRVVKRAAWRLRMQKTPGAILVRVRRAARAPATTNSGARSRARAAPEGFEAASEPASYAWLESAFDRLWLFQALSGIHADKNGKRNYVQPYDVKQKHPAAVRWAVKLFGSYKNAMEAWRPGAYAASLGKFTAEQFPDAELELLARDALLPLFQQNAFVSRERLRIAHPAEYHPVEAFRKRKNFDGYRDVLKHFGLPDELSSEDKKLVGHCGELFSLAHVYQRIATGESIAELHPRTPDEGKLEIRTDADPDKIILPDLAYGDGTALNMTEVKSGDAFPYWTGERILHKYRGTFSIKDGEAMPVRFTDIHIHMPRAHIEEGVLAPYGGKPALFDGTIAVLTAEDIARAFARRQAPAALQHLYTEFANRPAKFIGDRQNIARLEQLVTGLAPERFRERERTSEEY